MYLLESHTFQPYKTTLHVVTLHLITTVITNKVHTSIPYRVINKFSRSNIKNLNLFV